MQGSLNIPCALSRRQGGLNKVDLDQMAKAISLKNRSKMPKRDLCSALNLVEEPKKATALSKLLDKWKIDYTWNIEEIFYNKNKTIKGKKHVLVKWVGFKRPTYLPVENLAEEHVEQKVLSQIDEWRDRCGQLGFIENAKDLEADQLPYEDVILSGEFIAKDDIVRVDDRCWSRSSLKEWIRKFIENPNPPTNPVTRKEFTRQDIIDAGLNPQALLHFNPGLFRLEIFELSESIKMKEKRLQNEKQGIIEAPTGKKFIQVSVGSDHALALLDDGTVFGWGSNEAEKISGVYTSNFDLHQQGYDLFFVAVAAGHDHSLGMLNSGKIVGWGHNGFNQCNAPEFADDSIYFIQMTASLNYSAGVLNNGKIATWGRTEFYPLKPKQDSMYTFISAGVKEQAAVLEDGKVVKTNDSFPQLLNNKEAKMVSVGKNFSIVLFKDGSIGGTNIPEGIPKDKKFDFVSAGKYVLALEHDGTCHAWGLGAPKLGNVKFKTVSASHGTAKSAGISENGSIQLF